MQEAHILTAAECARLTARAREGRQRMDNLSLRGRVGRSKTRAYAYLTTTPDRSITEGADKRLQVLANLDSLGAGFQLASHDLDIRGAGNLLGDEQSGHIKEVGFEPYRPMLEEAIPEPQAVGRRRRAGVDRRAGGVRCQGGVASKGGVLRRRAGEAGAVAEVGSLVERLEADPRTESWQVTNLLTVSTALARAALMREETRGSHWREDFPERDDERWFGHIDTVMVGGELVAAYKSHAVHPVPAAEA
mgnify:CR=1 FL=1